MKVRLLMLFLLTGALATFACAADLENGFRNPPEQTKPWCYWYWLNNDITKEGVTKDLEAMARVGIKRAMIGNIEGGGPVKMFSPEWYEVTHHALKEANRLSVELMSFNAPGWSQSGGPWIKPEQSMRRVTWHEVPAQGGAFSRKVRPAGIDKSQDIAVLAVPRLDGVSIVGSPRPSEKAEALSLTNASWIWHPAENAPASAPAATRYFERRLQADPARLNSANVIVSADNSYVLTVNGREVLQDDNWKTQETASIKPYLKPGPNIIGIAVTNTEVGPAGVIAAVELKDKAGKVQTFVTDDSWLVSKSKTGDWQSPQVMGPMSMSPWRLSKAGTTGGVLQFKHSRPFTARALVVHGKANAKLYALQDGEWQFIADIHAAGGSDKTDFLPDGIETFSFKEVAAQTFELVPKPDCRVVLTSAPKVAQVIEKQMGRVHPTPSPTWESYIFPDTVEPDDPATAIRQESLLDLSDKMNDNGVLTCKLPKGNWDIMYFGMVTTGAKNSPAPPEATGLECDKMSRQHIEHHFNSMFSNLLKHMTPAEKAAFKGITIDS